MLSSLHTGKWIEKNNNKEQEEEEEEHLFLMESCKSRAPGRLSCPLMTVIVVVGCWLATPNGRAYRIESYIAPSVEQQLERTRTGRPAANVKSIS